MSSRHTGILAEYAEAECRRRRHPLVVKRRRMIARPQGPYGGPYRAPGEWEHWVQCACGAYRAPVTVERRELVGKRERVNDPI